ncbi:Lrp/AsnC ligand binding domain-containing protein, partial [Candidatus Bathyarchaeota archaeon]|nr:Lrp/AsnC ligand binding domain-containing protein [Candidatus Bathyarchaeota archaeon]
MKWGGYKLITGYVFIDAEKGRALEVASEVVKIKGVKTACSITGTFDVIATFEVKDIKDVGETVAKGIHGVDGV